MTAWVWSGSDGLDAGFPVYRLQPHVISSGSEKSDQPSVGSMALSKRDVTSNHVFRMPLILLYARP